MKRSIYTLPLTLSLFLSGHVSSNDLTEDDFLAEEPIIVSSVTRLNQEARNVPGSFTVIDRNMIDASSATTIVELMRLVPGFQVGSKWGNESTVTYHGLSGELNKRLHVLVNGRSLYDPALGGTLWHALPITIDEVESIEVIRGPNAAAYGANSFSGVINIKTYDASGLKGSTVAIAHGPERELNRIRGIHSGSSDRLDYRVSVELEQNDGFADAKLDRYPKGADWNDDLEQALVNSQFEIQSGNTIHKFDIGLKQLKLGTGFENASATGLPPDNNNIFRMYENYQWIQQDSLLKNNKIQITHSFLDQDGRRITEDGGHRSEQGTANPVHPQNGPNLTPPPRLPVKLWGEIKLRGFEDSDHAVYDLLDLTTHRLDLEFEHTNIYSPAFQYVLGAGGRYDYADSKGYFNGRDHDRFSGRLFGHLEYKVNKHLVFNTGGLFESHQHIDSYFSPRAALNLHLTDNQTLKTNWSQAYRVPSLVDEYGEIYSYDLFDDALHDFDAIGNPGLVAEQMTSLELGYLGQFFNEKLMIDIRIASEEIRKPIDTRKTRSPAGKRVITVPELRSLNYGWIDIESAELAVTLAPSKNTLITANAGYANSYGERAAETYGHSNTLHRPGDIEQFVPQLSSGMLVSHRFSNQLNVSAQYNFVESYTTGGEGDLVEAMETVDLKLAKKFDIGGNNLELIATVKNIFNNEYQDFDVDNIVGTESYIELKMDLN